MKTVLLGILKKEDDGGKTSGMLQVLDLQLCGLESNKCKER
jgi:hypothetical protein